MRRDVAFAPCSAGNARERPARPPGRYSNSRHAGRQYKSSILLHLQTEVETNGHTQVRRQDGSTPNTGPTTPRLPERPPSAELNTVRPTNTATFDADLKIGALSGKTQLRVHERCDVAMPLGWVTDTPRAHPVAGTPALSIALRRPSATDDARGPFSRRYAGRLRGW